MQGNTLRGYAGCVGEEIMRTMGVDLGTRHCGLAVLDAEQVQHTALLRPPKGATTLEAIQYQTEHLTELIDAWRPDWLGLEDYTHQGKRVGSWGEMRVLCDHLRRSAFAVPAERILWWAAEEWKPRFSARAIGTTPQERVGWVAHYRTKHNLLRLTQHEIDAIGLALVTYDEGSMQERMNALVEDAKKGLGY